jgi:hypothetical protein
MEMKWANSAEWSEVLNKIQIKVFLQTVIPTESLFVVLTASSGGCLYSINWFTFKKDTYSLCEASFV